MKKKWNEYALKVHTNEYAKYNKQYKDCSFAKDNGWPALPNHEFHRGKFDVVIRVLRWYKIGFACVDRRFVIFCAKVELKKIPFTEFTNQNLSHCSEFRNFCSYAINLLPFHKRIKKICFFPFLCGCWWNSFGSGESRDLMPGSLFTLRTIAHDLQMRLLLDGDNNKWAKKKGVLFFSFKWRQANAPTPLTHLLLNWCCI